jgi:endonuclease YncB( thermonuclease family)
MKAGVKAKERVQELLKKPFLIRTRWATAGGRGREARYYVIVEVDEKSLGEILISEGLARTKGVAPNLPTGDKAKIYMQKLDDLEAKAREKRAGAWSNSTSQKTDAMPTEGQSP